MANKSSNSEIYLPDGSFDWSGGVDSSLVTTLKSALNPGGLARSQTAWMYNCTVRGGGILQRTGVQPLLKLLAGGRWQGDFVYEPDSANPYLVFQVDGVLYRALLEPPYTVTDLTGGNPVLRNPPGAEMAWFVQGENYLVVQAGDYFTGPASTTINSYGQPLIAPSTTLPLIWDGTILRRSRGITTVVPAGYLPGINEIPAGTCMDYYEGRIWYGQARQISGGDMVGGSSGTLANHYRDSILSITENPLCVGGDGFTVPTNAGNIRAIKHSANLNAALGQGNLYIFTRKTIYSLSVPVTRTDWIAADSANQPLMTVVQLVNGAVGDRSIVTVNGDLFYQALEPSIRSLQVSVRNFGEWGNLPISQNELRALQINDRGLMRFSSGIQFDNRMLQLVLPVLAADGVNVVHSAILPLDFDVVSNLSTQGPTNVSGTSAVTPPVWEGAYDGLQFLQLFEGDFGGLHRGFSVVISEVDGSINIWELTTSSRTDDGDNRVTWGAEFPAFTWATAGLETKLKWLKGGELWIDKVFGTVDADVWYREDADPCWRFWFHTQFCAARGCQEAEPVCIAAYPPIPFREGYKWPIVFPEPKPACDSMGVRPTTIGYQFQTKVILKGWCRIRGLILYAMPHTEPQYHGIACQADIPMAKIPPPPPMPIPPPPPPVVIPPHNLILPVITGTALVGDVLSGSDGTWSNSPTGYTYRWLANGVAIGGATSNTFLLTLAQFGATITFEVTASNAGGSGAPATSVATGAVTRPLHALAIAWAAQVVTNGGGAPSGATVTTISDFCYSLDAGGLTSKFLALNCFVPGDLPTAFTPLIHNKGSDPWSNNPGDPAFLVGDLTVNGLIGDGTKCLLTGVVGTDFASTSSYGVTIYSYTGTAGSPQREIGFTDGPQTNALGAWVNETPFSLAILGSANGVVGDNTHGAGYYSGNRVSTTDARYFYGSSISPHALIGAIDAVLNTTALGNYAIFVFGQYRWDQGPNGYGLTHNRLSFAAIHSGLTETDSATLFTAVQAMRTGLGGGEV